MNAHRLWSGSALIGTATTLQVLAGGGWALALIAMVGVFLIVSSFAPEGGKRA